MLSTLALRLRPLPLCSAPALTPTPTSTPPPAPDVSHRLPLPPAPLFHPRPPLRPSSPTQVSVRQTEGHPTSMLDLEELGWLALKQAAGERAASLNQQAVLPCEHDERHRQVLHMLKVGWGGGGAGGGRRRLCWRACMMVHTRYVCMCVFVICVCGGAPCRCEEQPVKIVNPTSDDRQPSSSPCSRFPLPLFNIPCLHTPLTSLPLFTPHSTALCWMPLRTPTATAT